MNSEDRIIEDFFQEMKEKDKRIAIPLVPTHSHNKKQNWFPYSIAASLLLLVVTYVIIERPKPDEGYTINITLEPSRLNATQSLVDTDISIEEWESPTQSLIEDF